MEGIRVEQDIEHAVQIQADYVTLEGDLALPVDARGIVLLAHDSASSRLGPRSQLLAQEMREAGLATLQLDLLTPEEEAVDARTRQLRFDIDLLATRLVAATDWVLQKPEAQGLGVGYYGSRTGAAAALAAAVARADVVRAVVSLDGRPDLAASVLGRVEAPTLLIVEGMDYQVRRLNEQALQRLDTEKALEIVSGPMDMLAESAPLEEVARLTGSWFSHYLVPAREPVRVI